MGIPHGTLPRPPKAPGLAYGGADQGGARGADKIGQPVPVNLAGGEYIVGPHSVLKLGMAMARDRKLKNPTVRQLLNQGHEEIDSWILDTRKKHAKTLKKLPPPAKR
jgi:hypothetical protein